MKSSLAFVVWLLIDFIGKTEPNMRIPVLAEHKKASIACKGIRQRL